MADFSFLDFFVSCTASVLFYVLLLLLRKRYYLALFMRQAQQLAEATDFRLVIFCGDVQSCWMQYFYADEWRTIRAPNGVRISRRTPQALMEAFAVYGITNVPESPQKVQLF